MTNLTSIAGEVFYDDLINRGVKNIGDPGASGRTVFLDFDRDGILDDFEYVATTSTTGGYYFPGLTPGSYAVTLIPAFDAPTTPIVQEILIAPDRPNLDVDFGIR